MSLTYVGEKHYQNTSLLPQYQMYFDPFLIKKDIEKYRGGESSLFLTPWCVEYFGHDFRFEWQGYIQPFFSQQFGWTPAWSDCASILWKIRSKYSVNGDYVDIIEDLANQAVTTSSEREYGSEYLNHIRRWLGPGTDVTQTASFWVHVRLVSHPNNVYILGSGETPTSLQSFDPMLSCVIEV